MTVIGILPGGSQVAPLVLARSPPCGGGAGSSWWHGTVSHPNPPETVGGLCFLLLGGSWCLLHPSFLVVLAAAQVETDGWSWVQILLTPLSPAVALLPSGSAQRKRRPSPFSWQAACLLLSTTAAPGNHCMLSLMPVSWQASPVYVCTESLFKIIVVVLMYL